MRDTNLRSEKSIALEHVSTAWFAGTDGDGAYHFWSFRDQTFVVVDGETAETFHLDETPYESPGEWREHVAATRGWDDCRIGGSPIADAVEALA